MVEKKNKLKKNEFRIDPTEMMEKGIHLGHKTSKFHPKMKPFILGIKNNVHLIDTQKTAKKFEKALKFIKKNVSEGKNLLLVGTKPHLKKLVKETAEDCGLFYVNQRWLGGTFTNFKTISKRLDHLKDLEDKKEKGEFEKYTKREQLEIDREIKKLKGKFQGIKNMEKLPDVVFILDMKNNELAAKEAKRRGVKIIGLADTNVDPSLADYPIPANNDAMSSIEYILEKVSDVIKKNKTKK